MSSISIIQEIILNKNCMINNTYIRTSVILLTVVISGFFFTGCKKDRIVNNQTVSQTEIMPSTIVNGEILVSDLSEKEKELFIKTYYLTEAGLGPVNEVDRFSSLLILKSLTVNEIFEIAQSQNQEHNFEVDEAGSWEFAYITKKMATIFPKTFDDLSDDKKILFLEDVETFKKEKESSLDYLKSSGCSTFAFNFNAHQSNSYNRSCYYVGMAGNDPANPDCDYMLCFSGYGTGIKANSVIHSLITSSSWLGGFGGYNNIIIRKTGNRTYVLFGAGRTDIRLGILGISNKKQYLKDNVKLKV